MHSTITLPERIAPHTIASIHERLRAALKDGGAVEIDAGLFEEGDLTIVQLISSARLRALAGDCEIRLSAPANPALATLLDRCGLTPVTPEDVAFWFHGGPVS